MILSCGIDSVHDGAGGVGFKLDIVIEDRLVVYRLVVWLCRKPTSAVAAMSSPHMNGATDFLEQIQWFFTRRVELDALWHSVDVELQELTKALATPDRLSDDLKLRQHNLKGEPARNLAELYIAASKAKPVFDAFVAEAAQIGLVETDGIRLTDLKPRESTAEKMETFCREASGHLGESAKDKWKTLTKTETAASDVGAAHVFDVVRGTLVCQTADQLISVFKAVEQLTASPTSSKLQLLQVINHFNPPLPVGKRHVVLLLCSRVEGTRAVHICELQLHLQEIHEYVKRHDIDTIYRSSGLQLFLNDPMSWAKRLDLLQEVSQAGDVRVVAAQAMEDGFGTVETPKLEALRQLLELTNALDVAETVQQRLLEETARDLGKEHSLYATQLEELAGLREKQGNVEGAEQLYRESVAVREVLITKLDRYRSDAIRGQLQGPDKNAMARSLTCLAHMMERHERYSSAQDSFEQSLATTLSSQRRNLLDVAYCTSSISRVMEMQGKQRASLPKCDSAIAEFEQALGDDHPQLAVQLNRKARLLQFLDPLETLEEVETLYRRSLAIKEGVYGLNDVRLSPELGCLAQLLRDVGKLDEAEVLWRRYVQIQERVVGPKSPDLAMALDNLASLLKLQVKYKESLELYQRSLSIKELVYGENDPQVDAAVTHVAELLAALNEYSRAEDMYIRSVKLKRLSLGPGHIAVANALVSVAGVLEHQGKYSKAEEHLMSALKIIAERTWAESPEMAAPSSSLARVLLKQDKLDEAKRHATFALEIRDGVVASMEGQPAHSEHCLLADACLGLGHILRAMGESDDAMRQFKRSMRIHCQECGEESEEVANDAYELAKVHKAMGIYDQAERFFRQAADIRQSLFGAEDPSTIEILRSMSALLCDMEKYEEADPISRRVLHINERKYGRHNIMITADLNSLAQVLSAQGRYLEAMELRERILAVETKHYGEEHPQVAAAMNNQALLLKKLKRFEEARPMYERSLALREKVFGPEHPDVATSLNNIAVLLMDMGKPAEAEPLQRRALHISEKALGTEHADVAIRLNSLGTLLNKLARPREAEELYQRSLEIREKVHGPSHPAVATQLNNVAALLYSHKRYEEALPLFHRVLDIRRNKLGEEHPDTKMSIQWLQAFNQ
ncbi:hypothetical protein CYMTET_30280 [Cymbomonas tetramitiformis]|uniref:Kinesin light chain n=1 Tax=Cymbomonas tetramitiformis TaxID=36881 RepID=A0AAE0KUB2_9CHLO|nr:hypothetical protein CYMTET_30280 [Cymbomonas tetramitiformis]